MGRQYESDLIPASIFISDNKKGLLTVMEREAAGAARNSVAFKSMTKWVKGYDATAAFVKGNKKGLLALMDREAAGAARNSVAFKKTTKWLSFFGNKWYFAYLF